MVDTLLRIIAPHHCYGCGILGTLLCSNCKYDIVDEGRSGCVVCDRATTGGICNECRTTYQRAWCVGERRDALQKLIDGTKFRRQRDGCRPLADLLDACLPVLPPDTVVVPLPTAPGHARQRGYDHTKLIAAILARRRHLVARQVLSRRDTRMQRGRSKLQRFEQAAAAFTCQKNLDPDRPYLLIDDIITTNASVRFAAHALREAGARQVWVAVVARQPLEGENDRQ